MTEPAASKGSMPKSGTDPATKEGLRRSTKDLKEGAVEGRRSALLHSVGRFTLCLNGLYARIICSGRP